MTYAIINVGGRQEKVEKGDLLTVDKLAGSIGETVFLTPIMLVDDDKIKTSPNQLVDTEIKAKILDSKKAKKVRILKYKNKTGYRKRMGHRQDHTLIQILDIR